MESELLLYGGDKASFPVMNETTAKYFVKGTGLRVVTGIVCGLSIIGSFLIILAYVLFKNRRSRTREILVNISLMDLGVALSNLLGICINFDYLYYKYKNQPPEYIEGLCKTQTFFAAYCTYGSVFWTICLAAYIYLLIIQYSGKKMYYILVSCYVISYCLPLLPTMWLMFTGRLGHSRYGSSGWCTLIDYDPVTHKTDIYVTFFAYEFWMYLAAVLIPLFYIATKCYVSHHEHVKLAKKFVDYRFLLIPVIFLLLRMWSCIEAVIYDYVGLEYKDLPDWLSQTLLYLSGIGDSGQGFANAILFLPFSKSIRESVIQCFRCGKKRNQMQIQDEEKNHPPRPSPLTSIANNTSSPPTTDSDYCTSPTTPEKKPLFSDTYHTSVSREQFQSYRQNYGTLN